jgi:hypothetical protein
LKLNASGREVFTETGVDARAYYFFTRNNWLRLIARRSTLDRNVAAYIDTSVTARSYSTDGQILFGHRFSELSVLYIGIGNIKQSDDDLKSTGAQAFVKLNIGFDGNKGFF